jgi:hypothetical protein
VREQNQVYLERVAHTIVQPKPPPGYENISLEEETDNFIAWCEAGERRLQVGAKSSLLRPMPKSTLPPVFPTGPLNLNTDGTEINYKKSHAGPNAAYWAQADGEEIERLLTTATTKPLMFCNIPANKVVTYVNPVCVEKTNDDGSLKFRTRLTIGGDRIVYPYETTAVTAEMDALKILFNAMTFRGRKMVNH